MTSVTVGGITCLEEKEWRGEEKRGKEVMRHYSNEGYRSERCRNFSLLLPPDDAAEQAIKSIAGSLCRSPHT